MYVDLRCDVNVIITSNYLIWSIPAWNENHLQCLVQSPHNTIVSGSV